MKDCESKLDLGEQHSAPRVIKATKTTCSVTTCRTSDTHDKSGLTSATKVNQGMNRKTDVTEIAYKR